MATIYINIGSNSGHREALIEQAVAAVASCLGGKVRRSATVESEPWGFESENMFLNIGLAVETEGDVDPSEVLEKLQKAEKGIDASSHRDAEGRYVDRAIDIDLIAIDDMVVRSKSLTLPHPHAHERMFVMEPMTQLAPEWVHPLLGKSARRLRDELEG